MNVVRSAACLVIALLSGGCASTSPHFYTLLPESKHDPSAVAPGRYRLQVEVVRIPAQVDRLELVTRLPDGGISIADDHQWIAPVADELQNALAVELLGRLGRADPAGAAGSESVSVRLAVERFESSPNHYALIEASWDLKLKEGGDESRIVCRTRAYEQVRGGYPEVVRGYQRAVAVIADQIATLAQKSVAGAGAQCPAG